MTDLIEIDKYPVRDVLSLLLKDKTTGTNIIFATDTYSGYGYAEHDYMTETAVLGFSSCDIQPRVFKTQSEQNERTRKKAEVFTPAWVCNMMTGNFDSDWFGFEEVFNRQVNQGWITKTEKIKFPENKNWKMYVDSRRLEITCGEAPYIVSRYDATTGEIIPVNERIGILDRKLRVVSENTVTEDEWMKWVVRAYQSVYGYEFQGDNLLIARVNLLLSFSEYLEYNWHRKATKPELRKIANIIVWNIWQMDGLSDTVPAFILNDCVQMTFFEEKSEEHNEVIFCKVKDWRKECSFIFKDLKGRKKGKKMKFDYIIGNPPYQDNTLGENETFAPPIYNVFMESSYNLADKVELIHPARFLFNAGSTPKSWNQKMLHDRHFKILKYESDCKSFFIHSEIKGGISISYRDKTADYGEIGIFTQYPELNSILRKVTSHKDFSDFSKVVITRTAYRLTKKLHEDYPEAIGQLSDGHAYDMSSNIFERLPQVFQDSKPDDGLEYISILGRINNSRIYKFIRREYVNDVINLDKYKVFMPGANGNGTFGEIISSPMVVGPGVGSTETFISIGAYEGKYEAENTLKYIKTKITRALLNILKATQANTPEKWRCVPLQDFTDNSDIDWSKSIAEIDKQLYKKYGLSQEEINFIEKNVKEMT